MGYLDKLLARLLPRLGALEAEVAALRAELAQARADAAAAGRAAAAATGALGDLRQRLAWADERAEALRKELFFELRFRTEAAERLTDPEVMDRQRYDVKVARMTDGLLVNLGSGPKALPDHLSVDQRAVEGVDLRADARHLPFADGSVAELYTAHLIEHFPDEEMRTRVLPYWLRLLKPGGRLVVVCPDADAMIRRWAAGEFPYEHLREVTFGGQEYAGNTHYNMFTPDSLEALLVEVGFRDVRRLAVARPNGHCLEMELEAFKPG